jgi:hypothetical protein
MLPKPPILGSGIGISSLNVFHHISAVKQNQSRRLITQNVHLGETHNIQSEKFMDNGFCESNLSRSNDPALGEPF